VLLAIGLAVLVSGPVVAIAQTDARATYTGDLVVAASAHRRLVGPSHVHAVLAAAQRPV
jgi:hypothetical protein